MTPKQNGKFPWFPWFPSDWLTDAKVMTLSDAAYRAYHLLLNHEWLEGSLPGDDSRLAILSGAGPKWSEVRAEVMQFFCRKRGGKLHNKRLEAVRKEQIERSKANHDRAKKGAAGRWKNHATSNATSMPKALPQECHSESEPEPDNKPNQSGDLLSQYRENLEGETFGYVDRVLSALHDNPSERIQTLTTLDGKAAHRLQVAFACQSFEEAQRCVKTGKKAGYLVAICEKSASSWWIETGQHQSENIKVGHLAPLVTPTGQKRETPQERARQHDEAGAKRRRYMETGVRE